METETATNHNPFELDIDEEYDKFCGKIFLTTKRNYVFHCMLCESKFKGFDGYADHIKSMHMNSTTSDSELENSIDDEGWLEEQELPIETLQKKPTISVLRPKLKARPVRKPVPLNSSKKPEKEVVLKEIEDRSRPTQIVTSTNGIYACPHCPERFAVEFILKAHVKNHDSDRLHKCFICGVQFKSDGILRRHLVRHEKHKQHQCNECDRSFVNQSELVYHQRIHTGEKPFQCEYCGVRYTCRSSLRMHRKRQHTFQKDYVCPLCNKGFYASRFLRDHMTKHTNEPTYTCEKCGKKFNTSSCFQRHKAQHRKREELAKQDEPVDLNETKK